MSVSSASGAQTVWVTVDSGGDPWINFKGIDSGCWHNHDIETLIQELADAIDKVATLEDKPEPVLTLADIPEGTAFRFSANPALNIFYIKLTNQRAWSTATDRIVPLSERDLEREVKIEEAQDD